MVSLSYSIKAWTLLCLGAMLLAQGTMGDSYDASGSDQSVGESTDPNGGEYVYETYTSPDSYSYEEGSDGSSSTESTSDSSSSETSDHSSGGNKETLQIEEATIDSLGEWLKSGKATSKSLVEMYLERIKQFNPSLHAVLVTNQEAIGIATKLDEERAKGKVRGPLHGIPVLVTSTMETADKMDVSGGSKLLAGSHLPDESSIVQQLRKAGAVILGKGNMGEMNGLVGSNGYSTLGGQTVNPYNSKLPVSGSSSGSAVAVAANLVPVAVGEDSTGSIIIPSSLNAIVGMRPTVGLTSRTGNFLWSTEYDTYGPMARTVKDAAILLDAIKGSDDSDEATKQCPELRDQTFSQNLNTNTMKYARIALFASDGNYNHPEFPGSVKTSSANSLESAKIILTRLGARVLPTVRPNATHFIQGHLSFLDQTHTYLEKTVKSLQNGKIPSLEKLVNAYKALNDPKIRTVFLEGAMKSNGANSKAAGERLEFVNKYIRQYLLSIMDQQKITAFAFVTPSLSTQAFSFAKFPVITVPFGYTVDEGAPFSIAFAGAPCTDDQLLSYAYTFEQTINARKSPTLNK